MRSKFLFLILIILMLAMASCKNGTEVSLVQVTGDLYVEAGGTADSIRVSFYPAALSDPDAINIHQSMLDLGISEGSIKLFDHRDLSPVASAYTNEMGKFQVSMERGSYNIVISKPGYGIKYLYDILIDGDEFTINQAIDNTSRTILPEIILNGVSGSGSYVYDGSRNVVFSGNTTFDYGSVVTFSEGTIIRIAPQSVISFLGEVHITGSSNSPVRIISDSGMDFGSKVKTIQTYNKIQFMPGSNAAVTGLVLKDSVDGLVLHESANINNSLLSGKEFCSQVLDTDDVTYRNCVFWGRMESLNFALMISFLNTALVERSVFYQCASAVRMNSVASGTFQDNIIRNCGLGLLVENLSQVLSTHNDISCTQTGIRTYLSSNNEISYNNVEAPHGIEFTGSYSTGVVNYNNLTSTEKALRYISYRSGDLDAKHNYWNTTDLTVIDGLIQDKNDFPSNDPNYDILHFATYQPIRTAAIGNAGIRP